MVKLLRLSRMAKLLRAVPEHLGPQACACDMQACVFYAKSATLFLQRLGLGRGLAVQAYDHHERHQARYQVSVPRHRS